MKTATYRLVGGGTVDVEYDETAPCTICGEPVKAASMGGVDICPSCDCGKCRYCGVDLPFVSFDREATLRKIRDHIQWHKTQMEANAKK